GTRDQINAVFDALGAAFGVDHNAGNLANLVGRIANVYGLLNPVGGIVSLLMNLANPFSALDSLIAGGNPLAGIVQAVLGLVPGAQPILEAMLASVDLAPIVAMISRIASAHDTLDVGLEVLTQPM